MKRHQLSPVVEQVRPVCMEVVRGGHPIRLEHTSVNQHQPVAGGVQVLDDCAPDESSAPEYDDLHSVFVPNIALSAGFTPAVTYASASLTVLVR
jgi:hypothetical protein